MTGFEPATTRPPGVYATGLRYIPKLLSNPKYAIVCASWGLFACVLLEIGLQKYKSWPKQGL